jgi:hypothetical protein
MTAKGRLRYLAIARAGFGPMKAARDGPGGFMGAEEALSQTRIARAPARPHDGDHDRTHH